MKFASAMLVSLVLLTANSAKAADIGRCAYDVTTFTIENVRNTVGYQQGQQIEQLMKSAKLLCGARYFGLDDATIREGVNQAIAEALKPNRAK